MERLGETRSGGVDVDGVMWAGKDYAISLTE
jgi:hypothetical protein